jgi:Family of unknown function (DUF6529)
VEDLIERLTRGNVEEVKVVLASVIVALAGYQVTLMAVGYGKLRLPFLKPRAASFAHRTVGDTIAALAVAVAVACVSLAGFGVDGDDDLRTVIHAVAGSLVIIVLGFKIAVVRWLHQWGRFLPHLGLTVFALFVLTWLTSAADALGGG